MTSSLIRWLARFGLVSLLATGAVAQEWSREPSSLMGVPFGAPFSEATKIVHGWVTCADGQIESCIRVSPSLPELFDQEVFSFIGTERTFGGALLVFKSHLYPEVRATLTERYGEPTGRTETHVTFDDADTASGERLTWKGPNVTITLDQFGPQRGKGSVVVETTALNTASEAARSDRIRKAAAKF